MQLPYAQLIELLIDGAKEHENFDVFAIPDSNEFEVYIWKLNSPIPTYEEMEAIYPKYLKQIEEEKSEPTEMQKLAQQVSDLEIQLMEEQSFRAEISQMVSELESVVSGISGNPEKEVPK